MLSWRTLMLLTRERPDVLVVQNPSLICCVVTVVLKQFFGYVLIIDAHNEAVVPFNYNLGIVRTLARFLIRAADLTVVTNRQLAEIVASAGGRPFVLFDALPTPPLAKQSQPPVKSGVVVVNTFSPDEPLREILTAALEFERIDLKFYVTGKCPPNAAGEIGVLPPNVRLTGFLPDNEYWALLAGAKVVIDLTKMPNCLVCGAYEAIALGRPFILTEDAAAMDLFGAAAVYCRNERQSIAAAIENALTRVEDLERRVADLDLEMRERWRRLGADLMAKGDALARVKRGQAREMP